MRFAIRLAVVGTVASGLLLAATPAFASFVSIGPHGPGSQLEVSGGAEANDLEITRNGATFVVTDSAGMLTPGPGCSGGGTMVTCPDPSGSVARVVASGDFGDDVVVLAIALPSLIIGGPGADRLTGGPAKDRMDGSGDADRVMGGDGPDVIRGGTGGDSLVGGTGADRLFGEQGPDGLRARDGRKDLVDGGPARDRARADRKDRLRDVERVVF